MLVLFGHAPSFFHRTPFPNRVLFKEFSIFATCCQALLDCRSLRRRNQVYVSQQGQLFMQLECAQTSSSFGDTRDFFARCPLERSMRSISVIFGSTTDGPWCHHTLFHASFASQAAFCGCGFLWRFIAIQVSQKSAVASSTYPLIRARCCCATNGTCWRLESISYPRLSLSILHPEAQDEHSRLTL